VKDEKLRAAAPNNGIITDPETFRRLWRAWRGPELPPTLNFRKEIVVVATDRWRAAFILIKRSKEDPMAATVSIVYAGPVQDADGFSYALGHISRGYLYRNGIRTVNGVSIGTPAEFGNAEEEEEEGPVMFYYASLLYVVVGIVANPLIALFAWLACARARRNKRTGQLPWLVPVAIGSTLATMSFLLAALGSMFAVRELAVYTLARILGVLGVPVELYGIIRLWITLKGPPHPLVVSAVPGNFTAEPSPEGGRPQQTEPLPEATPAERAETTRCPHCGRVDHGLSRRGYCLHCKQDV
jgi:hypothetical protein